jgi:hypothetical protein
MTQFKIAVSSGLQPLWCAELSMGNQQQQWFADNPLAGREAEEMRALLEISQSLHSISLDELLLHIISKVKELMHAEGAAVILLDETKSEFFFCSAERTSEKCAVRSWGVG